MLTPGHWSNGLFSALPPNGNIDFNVFFFQAVLSDYLLEEESSSTHKKHHEAMEAATGAIQITVLSSVLKEKFTPKFKSSPYLLTQC